MAYRHNKNVADLSEELASLGVRGGIETMQTLSTKNLTEMIYETNVVKHVAEPEQYQVESTDPLDGDFVTRELLDRIVGLPLEDLDEDDIDEIIDGLKSKALPEDEEIREYATAVARALIDEGKKKQKIVGADGKISIVMKKTGGDAAIAKKGRRKNKSKLKKASKKYRRSAGFKMNKKKRARKGKKIKAAQQRIASDVTLADELRSLLDESTGVDSSHADIVDRIGRIYELLDESIYDEGVSDVLEESFDGLCDTLTEDDSDIIDAVKPCLSVMAACLRAIDEQEEYDDDDDNDIEDEDTKNY